jgi:hypothetical protein
LSFVDPTDFGSQCSAMTIALDQSLAFTVAYHGALPRRKQSMELPLQITFRHMDTSDVVAARIGERAEQLERFFDTIMSCRVVVECRHPRHQQGNLFRVRVNLKVPGREIVVGPRSRGAPCP